MNETCFLVLEDGTVFKGRSFGAPPPHAGELETGTIHEQTAGEVVFNTGMSGYFEILTDPSYTGQLVCMTYPHIGNYGTDWRWSETGPETGSDFPKIKPAGLITRKIYQGPLPEGRTGLSDILETAGTPGIWDIDTRKLTLKLRDEGSARGLIAAPEITNSHELSGSELKACIQFLNSFPPMEGRNLIGNVGSRTAAGYGPETEGPDRLTFALIDCGIKANILRELEKRSCRVELFPASADAEDILSCRPDGVLISNGPGDPAVLTAQIDTIKTLAGKVPLFGICLGHQLLALALGGKTYKMKFGHHGVNHPVREEGTKKVFVTSQNHGFSVDPASLPEGTDVWFTNANDGTLEGLVHREKQVMCVQFHPESAPGPDDSLWIFDVFIETARSAKCLPTEK